MGVSYRKSKNIGAGTKLNVATKSVGLSTGVKGARVSINSKGTTGINLSIPGTGLRYRKTFSAKKGGAAGFIIVPIIMFLNLTIYICKVMFIFLWWLMKLSIWLVYQIYRVLFLGFQWIYCKVRNKISESKNAKQENE